MKDKQYHNRSWLSTQYWKLNKSMPQIANEQNINDSTVWYWMDKHGIQRRSFSESQRGRTFSKETRVKMSEAKKGRRLSEETKLKMSLAALGKKKSLETRIRMSESQRGEKNPTWQGGVSFEPYCKLFDRMLKERIRNRDNRTCQLCGKSEILNGRRLAVHHIDGDKMQGCNKKKWHLVSLCNECNTREQFNRVLYEFLIVSNMKISKGEAM